MATKVPWRFPLTFLWIFHDYKWISRRLKQDTDQANKAKWAGSKFSENLEIGQLQWGFFPLYSVYLFVLFLPFKIIIHFLSLSETFKIPWLHLLILPGLVTLVKLFMNKSSIKNVRFVRTTFSFTRGLNNLKRIIKKYPPPSVNTHTRAHFHFNSSAITIPKRKKINRNFFVGILRIEAN